MLSMMVYLKVAFVAFKTLLTSLSERDFIVACKENIARFKTQAIAVFVILLMILALVPYLIVEMNDHKKILNKILVNQLVDKARGNIDIGAGILNGAIGRESLDAIITDCNLTQHGIAVLPGTFQDTDMSDIINEIRIILGNDYAAEAYEWITSGAMLSITIWNSTSILNGISTKYRFSVTQKTPDNLCNLTLRAEFDPVHKIYYQKNIFIGDFQCQSLKNSIINIALKAKIQKQYISYFLRHTKDTRLRNVYNLILLVSNKPIQYETLACKHGDNLSSGIKFFLDNFDPNSFQSRSSNRLA